MTSKTERELIAAAISTVVGGKPLKRYSRETITIGGHCAQLVRESVEGGIGMPGNSWPVAQAAYKYQAARGGTVRWASDYEKAAKELGLEKPFSQTRIGDVFYWPYTSRDGNAYGHTALNAGMIGGEWWVLENSDWLPSQRKAQGAKLPLGNGAHVYLTPLRLLGPPRTVIYPVQAIRDAETTRVPVAIITPAGPQAVPPPAPKPDVEYLWAPVIGVDGEPEPGGPVSVPIDSQGHLLVQADGKPKIMRVPESKWRK